MALFSHLMSVDSLDDFKDRKCKVIERVRE